MLSGCGAWMARSSAGFVISLNKMRLVVATGRPNKQHAWYAMPAPSRSLSVMRYVSLHSATSARIFAILADLESTAWNCGTAANVVSMSCSPVSSLKCPNVAAHTYLSAPKWPTMVPHLAGDSTRSRILFLFLLLFLLLFIVL